MSLYQEDTGLRQYLQKATPQEAGTCHRVQAMSSYIKTLQPDDSILSQIFKINKVKP
jgi:glucan phosphoethanolaminetransferase (alkaline phosphatase superfamily)